MELKKGIYRHFKGQIYKSIGLGKHSESLEELVVYINIENENDLWARPKEMFLDKVTRDGRSFKRFYFVEEI